MTDECAMRILTKDSVYMKTAVNYDLAVQVSLEALTIKPKLESEISHLKGSIREFCEERCEYAISCKKLNVTDKDFLKTQFCDKCPLGGIV